MIVRHDGRSPRESDLTDLKEGTGQRILKELLCLKEKAGLVVTYGYGDEILANGRVSTPCRECDSCKRLAAMQGPGCPPPLGIVLQGTAEVYLESGVGVQPQRLLGAGDVFNVFENIDGPASPIAIGGWSIAAGPRTVVLIAPVGNAEFHQRLVDLLQKETETPRVKSALRGAEPLPSARALRGYEDWHLLRALERARPSGWQARVLFVPRSALAAVRPAGRALELELELLRTGWSQSGALRAQRQREHALLLSRDAIANFTSAGFEAYTVHAIIRHLLEVAAGEVPALLPANVDSEDPADRLLSAHRDLIQSVLDSLSLDVTAVVLRSEHLGSASRLGLTSLNRPTGSGIALPDRHRKGTPKGILEPLGSILDTLGQSGVHELESLDFTATRLVSGTLREGPGKVGARRMYEQILRPAELVDLGIPAKVFSRHAFWKAAVLVGRRPS